MASARVKLPDELKNLLRSELEMAIYEAALSKEDDLIAKRYFVEKTPQIDIAAELGYERSTIGHRLPYITEAVMNAARKLKFT